MRIGSEGVLLPDTGTIDGHLVGDGILQVDVFASGVVQNQNQHICHFGAIAV
jgi:hypothetical protein